MTGHQVDTMLSPRQALQRLKEDSYDLILADLRYPDMSGIAFFDELADRSDSLTSRVMFITGATASQNTRHFLEGAGRPVIEKPFDLDVLRTRVAEELLKLAS